MVIRVRVVDAAQRPVSGAAIYISASPRPSPDIAQLTDDLGKAIVAAPVAGRYVIGSRSASATGEVTVDVRDTDVDAEISLKDSAD